MARGGARPGAGRPRKSPPAAVPAEAAPAQEGDGAETPLDYMLRVMRDPRTDAARRDRMAMAAAPFLHPRREAAGAGKKEAAADAAKKAAAGKFGARPAPLKLVGRA